MLRRKFVTNTAQIISDVYVAILLTPAQINQNRLSRHVTRRGGCVSCLRACLGARLEVFIDDDELMLNVLRCHLTY